MARKPRARAGRGSGRPITVEATKTRVGFNTNRSASSRAVQRVSAAPGLPVQALAHPELMITAWARGDRANVFWQ